MPDGSELRTERRRSISSIAMPFLGSRFEDRSPFQYLIMDISLHGARIALPKWVIKREVLSTGDLIDFNLPFIFGGKTYNRGRVAWERWDNETDAQICGVRFEDGEPAYYPVYISFDADKIDIDLTDFDGRENLVALVLKDSLLLKKGILIYLKHIAPIIPRIADIADEEVLELRKLLFGEIETREKRKIVLLSGFLDSFRNHECTEKEIYFCFDLERLRVAMEPEISMALWENAYRSKTLNNYLDAIRQLEQKLFCNYNTIVMIYMQEL